MPPNHSKLKRPPSSTVLTHHISQPSPGAHASSGPSGCPCMQGHAPSVGLHPQRSQHLHPEAPTPCVRKAPRSPNRPSAARHHAHVVRIHFMPSCCPGVKTQISFHVTGIVRWPVPRSMSLTMQELQCVDTSAAAGQQTILRSPCSKWQCFADRELGTGLAAGIAVVNRTAKLPQPRPRWVPAAPARVTSCERTCF